MSENTTPEERTELPTDRRMNQIRDEGGVFCSQEITQAISMLTAFYALKFLWPVIFNNLKEMFASIFKSIANPAPMNFDNLYAGLLNVLLAFGPPVFIFVSAIAVTTALATMLQTKWNIKKKWFKFDLGSLNPITGVMKIFSVQGFVSTGKALVKLLLILPIAYIALRKEADQMVQLLHTDLDHIFRFAAEEMWSLFWKIMYVLIAISIFDLGWGKFQWFKTNKMTKDEVKDERKSMEGDEKTKRKMISKGMQRIMARLNTTIPKATVIITNPTHYAVALQYDRDTMKAPTVIAKGKGFMALRIRELAKQSGVPILERKPLARALFASVEVGREIPYELYKAVAEVLAYVFKLKNPHRPAPAAQQNQQTLRP